MIKKIVLGVMVLCYTSSMWAQPFTMREDIKPYELTLSAVQSNNAKEKGKRAVVEVNQNKDTLYFFAKSLNIYSPVYFSLSLFKQTDQAKVYLVKDFWNNVARSGTTNEKGVYSEMFKTGGEIGIMVVCKKGTQYILMLWEGEEAPIDIPLPFKKRNK